LPLSSWPLSQASWPSSQVAKFDDDDRAGAEVLNALASQAVLRAPVPGSNRRPNKSDGPASLGRRGRAVTVAVAKRAGGFPARHHGRNEQPPDCGRAPACSGATTTPLWKPPRLTANASPAALGGSLAAFIHLSFEQGKHPRTCVPEVAGAGRRSSIRRTGGLATRRAGHSRAGRIGSIRPDRRSRHHCGEPPGAIRSCKSPAAITAKGERPSRRAIFPVA